MQAKTTQDGISRSACRPFNKMSDITHNLFVKNEHWQLLSTIIAAILIKDEGFGDCQMKEITKMYLNLDTTVLTDCKRKQKG